jgi:hypothetical protein
MSNVFLHKLHVNSNNGNKRGQSSIQKRCGKATLVMLSFLFVSMTYAAPADQANYIHERLTGVLT